MIFEQPDMDYLVFTLWLLHRKRKRRERLHRKRELTFILKLQWVISRRHWEISWGPRETYVLAPVQLILSVCKLYQRLTEKEMTSNKIKLDWI